MSNQNVKFTFVVTLLLLAAAALEASAPIDRDALHRALFRSYYADFVRRNPEAFVRERIAIVAPDQLATLNSLNAGVDSMDQVFRALPKPSLSIGIGPLSASYGLSQLGALRDLIARTPAGAGLPSNDIFDAELKDYLRTHPDEIEQTADVVYDLYRTGTQNGTSSTFTPGQLSLLKSEFDKEVAADGTLPKPTDSLESLLANAPPAFDRAMRALDSSSTNAQLASVRGDINALEKLVQDKLPPTATSQELASMVDGVAVELRDVHAFIQNERDVQARLKRSQEIHSAIDIVGVLLQTVDRKAGATFATVAHQTVAAAEAVAGMTAGLTITGVGTVVAAGFAIAQVLGDHGPSAEEQLQSFILELYRNIMAELKAIRQGLFEIRTQLAALDSRMADLQLDSNIGFNRVQLALADTRNTLDGLALESDRFYQAAFIANASVAHDGILDLMTNPANADSRKELINPQSPVAAATQQNLVAIAELGLHDAVNAPFSQAVQLDGTHVFATPRVATVENRVGDLAGVGALVAPSGAPIAVFVGVPHSVALAQSVLWYVDARDRLPRPAQTDNNFSLLCDEAHHVSAAAREARALTPNAIRFAARAARKTQQLIGATFHSPGTEVDAAYLEGTAVPPIPNELKDLVQAALFRVDRGGFATDDWVLAAPVPVTLRAPTADDLAHLDKSPFVVQPKPGDQVAVLDGCAFIEDVVFMNVPTVHQDGAFGIRVFDGDRLYIRDRRRYCSADHPVVAFPPKILGWRLEAAMGNVESLDEDPLTPEERQMNDAGASRILKILRQQRARQLADLARQDGIVSGPFSRRVPDNVSRTLRQTPLGLISVTVGCAEWHDEAIWSAEAKTVAPDDTKYAAWTYDVEQVCTPADGVLDSEFETFVTKHHTDRDVTYTTLPDFAFDPELANLDKVIAAVQNRRATSIVDTWTTRMLQPADPLTEAIDELRVSRYALDTLARYGYGDCGDSKDVIHQVLLEVTCSGDATCSKGAPDKRLKEGKAYFELFDAALAVARIASFDDAASTLDKELAANPTLCSGAGPYGLADALAVLNGLARRSSVFLPNGCAP